MSKSYVTITVCPICQEDKNELDTRLRDTFEHKTLSPEPCDTCKEKYLKTGTMLLNPKTGSVMVIADSAFKRIFNVEISKGKVAFCEEEVFNKLNIVKK